MFKENKEFWDNVDRGDSKECWNWTGKTYGHNGEQPRGYMTVHRHSNGKPLYGIGAHRIAWMIANSRSIPKGSMILHSCGNSLCVNPAHLFMGNAYVNYLQQIAQGKLRLKNHTSLPKMDLP